MKDIISITLLLSEWIQKEDKPHAITAEKTWKRSRKLA